MAKKSFKGRLDDKLDKAQQLGNTAEGDTAEAYPNKPEEKKKDPTARKKTSIMLKPRILRLFRILQDQELDQTGDHLSYSDIVEESVEDYAKKKGIDLD